MFVVRSPRGTFLIDEGVRNDRFAVWSYARHRATVLTRPEYDEMRREWPYLNGCELIPALKGARTWN